VFRVWGSGFRVYLEVFLHVHSGERSGKGPGPLCNLQGFGLEDSGLRIQGLGSRE